MMIPRNIENKKLPIGVSDFRNLRQDERYYVDKSPFIDEVLNTSADVILLPRPRRFGKTLNLSMLKYFFDMNVEDGAALFTGTQIAELDAFGQHLGQYPVIWLTFKDLKARSWKDQYRGLTNLLKNLFDQHIAVLKSGLLSENEKRYFESVLDDRAEPQDYSEALQHLSRYLYKVYKRKTVILIDEYDTPIHAGYLNGYYDEIINFMRGLLSGALKDNEYLFKGVLTGILRVAKESIFSGLNNLGVYTLLDKEFNSAFGFTEPEVTKLLQDYDLANHYDDVAFWYDGYLFGDKIIYNPWSLLNFAASIEHIPKPYWANTASSEIIEQIATRGGREIREEVGLLLEGHFIEKPIYENIVLRDLDRREDLFWSFLLFSGYLKATERVDYATWKLETPNQEVHTIYYELVRCWFDEKVRSDQIEAMLKGLTTGDVVLFERMLRKIVLRIMSYHDLAGESEKVYHALVLGMLVWLQDRYEMRSNRESGYGRYDLMLKPRQAGASGIIIEFKQVDEYTGEKPEKALENALKQIEKRKYAAELVDAGVTAILKLAIVFRGKELWVKQG